MYVVVDTNVLVSAFWARDSKPAAILSMIINKEITPCIDHRIMCEYRGVLIRPKFGFRQSEVNDVLRMISDESMSAIAPPLDFGFVDKSDKMFFEVAMQMDAILITGNARHFPKHKNVMTPAEFLNSINK